MAALHAMILLIHLVRLSIHLVVWWASHGVVATAHWPSWHLIGVHALVAHLHVATCILAMLTTVLRRWLAILGRLLTHTWWAT